MLEQYIDALKVGDTEKGRVKKAVKNMQAILKELELSSPNETAYSLYKERHNDTQLQANIRRIEKYYIHEQKEMKGVHQMTIEDIAPITEQVTTPEATAEAVNVEHDTNETTEAVSSKRGRPKKEGNYTERVSIYITPELDTQLNAVCEAFKISKTEFVVKILEEHIYDYKDKLLAEYEQRQKKILEVFSNK